MTKSEEMLLRFMKTTIKRVNQSLAMNYATQQALIEAGLITEKQMQRHISRALQLPHIRIGREALKQMLGGPIEKERTEHTDPSGREDDDSLKNILDAMDTTLPEGS